MFIPVSKSGTLYILVHVDCIQIMSEELFTVNGLFILQTLTCNFFYVIFYFSSFGSEKWNVLPKIRLATTPVNEPTSTNLGFSSRTTVDAQQRLICSTMNLSRNVLPLPAPPVNISSFFLKSVNREWGSGSHMLSTLLIKIPCQTKKNTVTKGSNKK